MDDAVHQEIGRSFQAAQRILVASHVRPDGDAIGSILGLGQALQDSGKHVQMALNDGVPQALRHLVGSQQIVKRAEKPVDLVVVLDCSDLQRVGSVLEPLPTPDINIDHHLTNLQFARLNLVDPAAVSTTAVLARHMSGWGLTITPAVASALLTGLVSDTIGFRTSNMNPEALRLAADLMEMGANLPELYNLALVRRSFPAALYWGAGLSRLQRKGRLVWTSLTLADRENAAYLGNDDADLVNILSSISDSDVAVIFVEQKSGRVKVSWRAIPGYDVSRVALAFGGGGHAAAAGAEIFGNLNDVQEQVLLETEKIFQNGHVRV